MSSGTFGPESQLGHVIGGYQLEAVVGKGGTGIVFRGKRVDGSAAAVERTAAYAIELPPVAAVKLLVIPWQASAEERAEQTKRFEHEIRILGALQHPHILPIIAHGLDEGTGSPYMILPYLPDGSLTQKLKAQSLTLDEAARLLTQVASAIDYASDKGVLHRDIKPDNILLDDAGQAYLADFSIAKMQEEFTARVTQSGMFVGTLAYVAPEVRLKPKEANLRSDIYSLGVTVYEMLVGMRRDSEADPAALRALRPDLPMPAAQVIAKALSATTTNRFATATEFAEAFSLGLQGFWPAGVELQPVVADGGLPPGDKTSAEQTAADVGPSGPPVLRERPRPSRGLIAALGALAAVLLVACILGLSFLGHGPFVGLGALGAASATGKPKVNVVPTATAKKRAATATPTHHSGGSSHTGGGTTTIIIGGGPSATATHTPTPRPTATFTPTPTPLIPTVTPTNTPVVRSIQIGWSTQYQSWIWMTVNNFSAGYYTYYCTFSTPPQSTGFSIHITSSPEHWDAKNTCYDTQHGDHVWVVINGVASNQLTVP
ncbi:MAG TPA: serine/threonine-protein kinase [Ktedonobacterales bacterium]